MAATVKAELKLDAEVVKVPGSVFDVSVDGVVVAHKVPRRFPTDEEIVDAIARAR